MPPVTTPQDQAHWIYRANVTDFRGPGEPDLGTAFEIGFAIASGKPVWAYATDRGKQQDRVSFSLTSNGPVCEKGFLVEDFGLFQEPDDCLLRPHRSRRCANVPGNDGRDVRSRSAPSSL